MKEISQVRSQNSGLAHLKLTESLLVVVKHDLKMNLMAIRNKLPGIKLRVWGSFFKGPHANRDPARLPSSFFSGNPTDIFVSHCIIKKSIEKSATSLKILSFGFSNSLGS